MDIRIHGSRLTQVQAGIARPAQDGERTGRVFITGRELAEGPGAVPRGGTSQPIEGGLRAALARVDPAGPFVEQAVRDAIVDWTLTSRFNGRLSPEQREDYGRRICAGLEDDPVMNARIQKIVSSLGELQRS
jgi:hypothetical protein